MNKRNFIQSVGGAVMALAIAGCSDTGGNGGNGGSSELVQSGSLRGEDDVIHNIDVESGETIRIEVDNEAGVITFVQVLGPDRETLLDEEVETQDTLTYTADGPGTYQVFVSSDSDTSYEIYIDSA